MFLVVWEFEVKPDCVERFLRIYGPTGDWSRLFSCDQDFKMTRLVQDPTRTCMYLTLDFWTDGKAYESFKQTHQQDYAALDLICEELTVSERHIGSFEEVSGPAT